MLCYVTAAHPSLLREPERADMSGGDGPSHAKSHSTADLEGPAEPQPAQKRKHEDRHRDSSDSDGDSDSSSDEERRRQEALPCSTLTPRRHSRTCTHAHSPWPHRRDSPP